MNPSTVDIQYILRSIVFPALAAGSLAAVIWVIASGLAASSKSRAEKALADFNRIAVPRNISTALMGTKEFKLRLAYKSYIGLDVSGWEYLALYMTYGIVGGVLFAAVLFMKLPLALLIGAPFIGFVVVSAMIDSKWDAMRIDIEKEVPLMLNRLASLLKANPNLIETMDNIAEGLDPAKPLKRWVREFAARLQKSGHQGLEEAKAEAQLISPSLLLAVVEIGRLWETGGSGYGEALRLAAANMGDLMETRSQAQAVAVGAWGTIRTILLALGFTLGMVIINPMSKPYFSTPIMQIALLALMLWGGMGYWNIKDAINEVVE